LQCNIKCSRILKREELSNLFYEANITDSKPWAV
jgi:hypothetical protein